MTLRYGDRGPTVRALQDRLDAVGPTRLPRLGGDSDYGPLTMARVMEFQDTVGIEEDGIAGSGTMNRLDRRRRDASPPNGRCILVDLINRRLRAYENGRLAHDIRPIIGGRQGHPSTRGVYYVNRREREHTSSLYPTPPGNMDLSLFYNGPEAIHQGDPSSPSHGCIHVARPRQEQLYNWAENGSVMVIVLMQDATPPRARGARPRH